MHFQPLLHLFLIRHGGAAPATMLATVGAMGSTANFPLEVVQMHRPKCASPLEGN
jgi:hypothetical protein